MAGYIDLHMHTIHSDGTCDAAGLLNLVRQSRIQAFAVTDHDTLEGYQRVKALLSDGDPELVAGVELSAVIGSDDVHLLAYLFDPENRSLLDGLADFQHKRNLRGRLMVERLEALGVSIPFEAVEQTAAGSVIGRPHIAQALYSLKAVGSYQEAFDRFIGRSGPAYVPKVMLSPEQAIEMVHSAGGVVALAHPFIDDMAKHLDILVDAGLGALEVYHATHTSRDVKRLARIAEERDLVPVGGSDFHGREGRYGMIGSQHVPADCLEALKRRAHSMRGTK